MQAIDRIGNKERTKDGHEDDYEDRHELDERGVTTSLQHQDVFINKHWRVLRNKIRPQNEQTLSYQYKLSGRLYYF